MRSRILTPGPTVIRNWDCEPTETGRIVMHELKSGGE